MRYPTLGGAGLRISEVVLGAARFGEFDDAAVDHIVGIAIDAGVTTFDTADIYNGGRSEELLGGALKGRRDRVVVCTKVGLRVGDTEADHLAAFRPGGLDHADRWRRGISPNDQGLSRRHIVAALDASLRRLGTDHIDLYQVHKWDAETPIEETLRVLDDMVRVGKVRYIGCSAFASWQLYRALWTSDVRGLVRFDSIQGPYNFLNRANEADLFPACAAESVGVLAFQVLAGGMLAARYTERDEPAPTSRLGSRSVYRSRYWTGATFEAVGKLQALADEIGRTPAALAAGWVLANPAVSGVLFGVSRADQLVEAVDAVERPLTAEEVAAVSGLTSDTA